LVAAALERNPGSPRAARMHLALAAQP